ncbi:MAG: ATP-binding protein [Sphingopyxis sp.]
MDDLLREFVGETLDMMEAVAGDLVAWEADPADRSGLDRIFRTIHTVKGSSSFFELPRITAIAHASEDVLAALRARRRHPDRKSVEAILAAFDQIRFLAQAISSEGHEPQGDDNALIADLISRVRSRSAEQDGKDADPAVKERTGALSDSMAMTGQVVTEWRSVRVPLTLLDKVMSEMSDLVLARNEVSIHLRSLGIDPHDMAVFSRMSDLIGNVRASISQMRMVPLRAMFAPLPRMVRQLSDELSKPVQLRSVGGEVEIDREIIESLRDPIIHVLRNAIDHGIETAEGRAAAGKTPLSTISITGRQAGNRILIAIADDGRGLAEQSLVDRAVASRHYSAEQCASFTAAQMANLIFLPGLSTAKAVTGISGRGVGMDVVKANVERLGGCVTIDNRPGAGVTITIDVPMTLTIISALAIDVAGNGYAIPRNIVDEVVLLSNDAVQRVDTGGMKMARVRGQMMPRVELETILGMTCASDESDESDESDDRALILCRAAGSQSFAIEVPDVRDLEELVIKPLPPMLAAIGIFNGFSLPDYGRPMLVLDVDGIADRAIGKGELGGTVSLGDGVAPGDVTDRRSDVMGERWLVYRGWNGACLSALAMTSIGKLIDVDCGQLQQAGGRIVAHIDGQLIAVEAECFDIPLSGAVRMILVHEGSRIALIPIKEVVNLTALSMQMPSKRAGATVLGLAMVDDGIVEMLSAARLIDRLEFAADSGASGTGKQPAPARKRSARRE